jgi:hypothetical protein
MKETAAKESVVVRGRYVGRTFIPEEALPEMEGAAELVITPLSSAATKSVFDLFGKAPKLRPVEDIAAQIQAERLAWEEA